MPITAQSVKLTMMREINLRIFCEFMGLLTKGFRSLTVTA
jgi:hypothetical protein